LQFCVVGASGAAVDLIAFNLCLLMISLPISRAVAIGTAVTSNFWLNRRLTFSYSQRKWVGAYVSFALGCALGAVVNWSISIALIGHISTFHNHVTFAALVGVASGAIFNFLLSSQWAFGRLPHEKVH
jgi:dolichol-phosphate mannosyltransferase